MLVATEEDESMIFFFQAEDGIRGYDVTGVQTCALPIFLNFCKMFWNICSSIIYQNINFFLFINNLLNLVVVSYIPDKRITF